MMALSTIAVAAMFLALCAFGNTGTATETGAIS
ncbi:Hypothetical protein BIBO2_2778 [Brucella sp. BO2]|nr:Hypothetical protein BIBO2_2778 [Brucella sp. BO2]